MKGRFIVIYGAILLFAWLMVGKLMDVTNRTPYSCLGTDGCRAAVLNGSRLLSSHDDVHLLIGTNTLALPTEPGVVEVEFTYRGGEAYLFVTGKPPYVSGDRITNVKLRKSFR